MESSPQFFLLSLLVIFSFHPSVPGRDDIAGFRLINRRSLADCTDSYPYLSIDASPNSPLPNEVNVTVTVSGVPDPNELDWVAMITPTNSRPEIKQDLPLLCHYPVKAQYLRNDPFYLSCKHKTCHEKFGNDCANITCSGTVVFHVINIRTDIEFVFFSGGFSNPCMVKRSNPLHFSSPAMPLYGHISSVDSAGTMMRLTWVSGDKRPQEVQYGLEPKSSISDVTSFTDEDMSSFGPAHDFGWHDPGYIHSAIMTGLTPSSTYTYRYGSELAGWSDIIKFNTPPASGSDKLTFLVYGDMGKAPLDPSTEHYIQPGSISVAKAIEKELEGHVDSIFHIGDISYATGFLVEWEYFLNLIEPIASSVSYMTAIGNHEIDYPGAGTVEDLTDSGGELGVPYETYFQMPVLNKNEPWYSIEQGPVHFTVVSTEHDWSEGSKQFEWIKADMASVKRTRTPWLIFTGHRPMYSSNDGSPIQTVNVDFRNSLEPLLLYHKADLVLVAHIHNYERTCAIFQDNCKGMPIKGKDGVDIYDNDNYTAPVHVMAGMAGFELNDFPNVKNWSLARYEEFGFGRVHATKTDLLFQFVNSTGLLVRDSFRIVKKASSFIS